jgi:hypothetical protein
MSQADDSPPARLGVADSCDNSRGGAIAEIHSSHESLALDVSRSAVMHRHPSHARRLGQCWQ